MRFCGVVGALVVLAACASGAADADAKMEIDALILTIKKVGREGTNNPDASRAWKTLVAKGQPAIFPILQAMEDDDATAGNWLRPAVEAIAQNMAKAKDSPRAADLEKFVLDSRYAGSARRIAYEWLVKLDKTAPDRLLPGMLTDTSAEMRRDAVGRVIKLAESKLEAKDETAARKAFQLAFKSACDDDQVDTCAEALKKLGVQVDLARHYGFVTQWHLVGPFDNTKGIGWKKAYPPEKGVSLSDEYDGKSGKIKWQPFATDRPDGMVNLKKGLDHYKGAIAYAYAEVESPSERTVELRAGSITALAIFLNGKEIFNCEEYHHGMRIDQYSPRGLLKKGKNAILLKIGQNEQTEAWAQKWQVQLRLCDFVGAGVPFEQQKVAFKGSK